jgi:hypothetical protein
MGINVPDDSVGRSCNCPMCGASQLVPSQVLAVPANFELVQEPEDDLAALARANEESLGGYAPHVSSFSASYHVTYGGYGTHRRAGQSYGGMAVAGFVLSLVFPLLGLIFSWIALSGMARTGNPENKGLAQAGLVISIIFVALSCLWCMLIFGAIAHTVGR